MRYDLAPLLLPSCIAALALGCGSSGSGDGGSEASSGPGDSGTSASSATVASADTSNATSSADTSASTGTTADPACATPLGTDATPIFDRPPGQFAFRNASTYRTMQGFLPDGPRVSFHQESARDGACRLLTYTASNCDPACLPPSVCIDEACATPTSGLSAGAVTLDGVGTETIAISEDAFHNYFWDHEGSDELSMLSLHAVGADVEAFDLSVCPVSPATAIGDWSALLEARAPGEAVTLTWSDPLDNARIYLRMTTGIATHGGISPVEIECEGPDVGALELPGDYLDALYSDGWACGRCGGNELIRYYADETGTDGVQFRSEAVTNFWFIP